MWEAGAKSTKLTPFRFSASLYVRCKSRPKSTKLTLFGAGLIPFRACGQTHTSSPVNQNSVIMALISQYSTSARIELALVASFTLVASSALMT